MQLDQERGNLQEQLRKPGVLLTAASKTLDRNMALEATPDAARDVGRNSGAPASDVGKASEPRHIEHDLGL